MTNNKSSDTKNLPTSIENNDSNNKNKKESSTEKTPARKILVQKDKTKSTEQHPANIPSQHAQECYDNYDEEYIQDERPFYSDNFTLISDAFDSDNVKVFELPKLMFKHHASNRTQSIADKATLLLTLRSDSEAIASGVFKKIYLAAQKSNIQLELNWLNKPGGKKVISKWKFIGPRICGLDFGTLAPIKEEDSGFMCEIEYENLEIDSTVF